jgi:hypothetical protein
VYTRSEGSAGASSRKLTLRQVASLGLIAAFVGGAIVAVNLYVAHRLGTHVSGTPYADVLVRLDDPLDILFALGDGQASVAIARDPTLSHVEVFRGANGEASLRASRPLQGYLGWIFSVGHPQWAEEGVLIATLFGCSFAVIGCGELFRRRKQSPWLGLLVLELPGSLAAIRQFGPEIIGLGLVALALVARDDDRPWLSVALFSLAGLARETYLLIPLLFAWRDRRLLIPHSIWFAWVCFVWLRFGTFGPLVNLHGSRLLVPPFSGLARAIPHLDFPLVTGFLLAFIPVTVILVWLKRGQDPLTPIVISYGIFAIFLSGAILDWWASFSRVLLPMTAFAMVALISTKRHAHPLVVTD